MKKVIVYRKGDEAPFLGRNFATDAEIVAEVISQTKNGFVCEVVEGDIFIDIKGTARKLNPKEIIRAGDFYSSDETAYNLVSAVKNRVGTEVGTSVFWRVENVRKDEGMD